MELSGRRVVVTGGAGFIGSHVVDRLVSLDVDTLVIDDLSVGTRSNVASAEEAGAHFSAGDVRDAALMDRELRGADIVIHMACGNLRASLSDPMRVQDINAVGTLVCCLAAINAGVERFVYISSSEAYGSAQKTPMDEDHPLLPTTVYGASKAAGELYAQSCGRTYGMQVTVVRPFNSYGPREHATGDSAEVIPKFVTRMLAGLPPVIFGDGLQNRDFTWVEETAAGIIDAVACDALVGEAVNIAHGVGVSIRQVADLLAGITGANGLNPLFDERRPGDVDCHVAGTAKARDVVGFEAGIGIEQGLRRYVDWVRANEDVEAITASQAIRNW